jgi:hypothetical protein
MKKFLLVIIVLLGLGGISYASWQFLDRNEAPQSQSDEWFEIPEWGVKFKPGKEAAEDLVYEKRDLGRDADTVLFGSKALAAKYDFCTLANNGLGYMVERSELKVIKETEHLEGDRPQVYKDIPPFRYFRLTGGPSCPNDITEEEFTKYYTTLQSSFFATLTEL